MTHLLAGVGLGLLLAGAAHAANCDDTGQDPWDTGYRALDCDGDGVTRGEGDCDDLDETVNPDAEESCDDDKDNDCNGYFNDGCDDGLRRGSLLGGSSCGIGGASALILIPPLLLGVKRRR